MLKRTPPHYPKATPVMPANAQSVSRSSTGEVISVLMPMRQMTRAEALDHAAWIVALAEVHDGEFRDVLNRVRGT